MADGQVVFEITSDNRKAISGIKEVTDSIKSESKKWDDAAEQGTDQVENRFVSMAKKVGGVLAAAGVAKKLLDWGKAAIDAASDLREVQNVVDTTFGESANRIEEWSKKAGAQFGLTETQAKRFTSTLGAMMKSAGMAGPEIVEMSTDLAGLAADMASFYNLDFETAFQKIRSGISGETEPLKQLGINMSVANLEAYALSQGITKAFDKMSQSEQTMLRYQYLMQATADAQGDFAKTADGYANSTRRIQTAVDTMKTAAGNLMLLVLEPLAGTLADFLETLTGGINKKTVIEEFNEINVDTDTKLAEIEKIHAQASEMISLLGSIGAEAINTSNLATAVEAMEGDLSGLDEKARGTASTLGKLAGSANQISASAGKRWDDFISAFDGASGFTDAVEAAKNNDYAGVISGLSESLSQTTNFKKDDWTEMLDTLATKVPDLNDILQNEGVSGAMEAIAGAADDLGEQYPGMWQALVDALGSDSAVTMINALSGGASAGTYLGTIAGSANKLDADSQKHWTGWMQAVQKVTNSTFGRDAATASGKINSLAEALSGKSMNQSRAEAFKELINIMLADAGSLAELGGTDAEGVATFLTDIANAANVLDPNDAEGWSTLLSALTAGFSGEVGSAVGKTFLESLSAYFLALGSDSEEGAAGLKALGLSEEEIAAAQAKWLMNLNELQKEIPGLSDLINKETGEVKGGADALQGYVDEWKKQQEALIRWKAYYRQRDAIESAKQDLADYENKITQARAKANIEARKLANIVGQDVFDELDKSYQATGTIDRNILNRMHTGPYVMHSENDPVDALERYAAALGGITTAQDEYTKKAEELNQTEEIQAEMYAILAEELGVIEEAADDAGESIRELSSTEKTAIQTAQESLQAVADYVTNLKAATMDSISGTVKGLEEVVTPGQKAERELKSLNDQLEKLGPRTKENEKEWDRLNKQINEFGNTRVSAHDIKTNLQSQIDFMNTYLMNLEKARTMGFNGELLASLSDGSTESADYLAALANATPQQIEQINALYAEVQAGKQEMTDTLTEQKLAVDEVYDGLVEKARESIAALNLGDVASEAMGETISGLAQGINDHEGEVAAAVNAIIADLDRLNGYGIFISGFGNFSYKGGSILNGSHESGLDYVPFDNYLAALHEGEGILTAEENRIWQDFKNGGRGVDYDTLGGVMRDNVRAGGNVYLSGQIVGRVISEEQGNSFRSLTRSGWQQR